MKVELIRMLYFEIPSWSIMGSYPLNKCVWLPGVLDYTTKIIKPLAIKMKCKTINMTIVFEMVNQAEALDSV